MYYYRLDYSEPYQEDGEYICTVDFTKVKIGKRNKDKAVSVWYAAVYAYAIILDDKNVYKPKYLVSDKDNVDEVKRDLNEASEKLMTWLIEKSEKIIKEESLTKDKV